MDINHFEAILFDFGNTIADEFFFRCSSEQIPNFDQVMREIVYRSYEEDSSGDNLLNQWMRGRKKKEDIATAVAQSTQHSVGEVLRLIEKGCRNLTIFHSVLDWAQKISSTKKIAIVTINADIFSEFIVGEYNLDKIFPVIVNSCHHDTLDKVVICKEALKQMGDLSIKKALLIDNTKQCCDDFTAAGGSAYLFEGEVKFKTDVTS